MVRSVRDQDDADERTIVTADLLFEGGDIAVTAAVRDGAILLTLTGVSEAKSFAPTPAAFFAGIVRAIAPHTEGREVEVDLRAIEHVSSGTVAAIVATVKALDGKGVSTVLRFDASVRWQRVNARCMKAIARCLKSVRVDV